MYGENNCLMPSRIVLTKNGHRIKGRGSAYDLTLAALSIGAAFAEYDHDGPILWTTRDDEQASETYAAYAERNEGWVHFNGFKHRTEIPAYVIAAKGGIACNPRSESGRRFTACLVVAVVDDCGEVLHVVLRPFEVGGAKHDDANDRLWEDLASSLPVGEIVTLHPALGTGSLMLKGVSSRHHDASADGPRQPRALVQLTIDAVSQDGDVLFDRKAYTPVEGAAGRTELVAYPRVEFNVFRPLPEGVLETLTALAAGDPAAAETEQESAARAA